MEDFLFVGVYGDPSRLRNSEVWELIDSQMGDMTKPTCVVGDFNAIAAANEKLGGNEGLSTQNRHFNEWINSAELIDLGYHGPCFTWSKKRAAVANVSERLDRALENTAWTLKYSKTDVFHIPRFNSDHMPILVRTEPRPIGKLKVFTTENWWLAEEDFKGICLKATERGNNDWDSVRSELKKEVAKWEAVKKSPQVMLKKVEAEMLELNGKVQTQ